MSSSSSFFNEARIDEYQETLTPSIPYLTADYALPTLDNHHDGVNLSWESADLSIIDNVIVYPHPGQDMEITITAVIAKDAELVSLSFPLLVKSQLDVPEYEFRPVLSLNLDDGRRENEIYYEGYLRASVSVNADVNGNYINQIIESPMGIRTRGHTTRFMPKRSYRVRFDENTSLYGMKPAKNYILLANYLDRSLVRNSLVIWMSKFYQKTMYALDYRFVDLNINGTYYGQYLLTERVEFQKNRLNITPNLEFDDAGFLVELDYQVYVQNLGNENLEWFRMNDTPYVIKEPNPLDMDIGYKFKHTRYINNYFHATRDALIAKTDYESYLDAENWLDYFLIQEITKNVDVGWGSVFLVKETGGKLKHMPLWDFDLAIGNADYVDAGPEGHWGWKTYNKNYFFTLLMEIPELQARFKEKLLDFQTNILPRVLAWLTDNEARLVMLSAANFTKWPMNSCNGWCPIPTDIKNLTSIGQQFDYISNYLTVRVNWMINNI